MNAILVYGSLLGKTKRISTLIAHLLNKSGITITLKAAQDTNAEELKYYDTIILGCSTWDDGMLQFDFRRLNDELLTKDFSGKSFAVFGLGGHRYPHFCASVDIIEKTVQSIQGHLIIESMRLDIDHDEPEDKMDKEVVEWTEKLIKILS